MITGKKKSSILVVSVLWNVTPCKEQHRLKRLIPFFFYSLSSEDTGTYSRTYIYLILTAQIFVRTWACVWIFLEVVVPPGASSHIYSASGKIMHLPILFLSRSVSPLHSSNSDHFFCRPGYESWFSLFLPSFNQLCFDFNTPLPPHYSLCCYECFPFGAKCKLDWTVVARALWETYSSPKKLGDGFQRNTDKDCPVP